MSCLVLSNIFCQLQLPTCGLVLFSLFSFIENECYVDLFLLLLLFVVEINFMISILLKVGGGGFKKVKLKLKKKGRGKNLLTCKHKTETIYLP